MHDDEDDGFADAVAEHVALGVPLGVRDPRLKALCATSGHLDPVAIKGLLAKPPSTLMDTLTVPQIEALGVILLETESLLEHAPWLAKLPYHKDWDEAIVRLLGGTHTCEKVRHGEVVERTVEHHAGRADVRHERAKQSKPIVPATAPIRASARARGAGRPRAAASRVGAASGDSGSDGGLDDEPPAPAPRSVAGFRHVSETLADELDRLAGLLDRETVR